MRKVHVPSGGPGLAFRNRHASYTRLSFYCLTLTSLVPYVALCAQPEALPCSLLWYFIVEVHCTNGSCVLQSSPYDVITS
jgi:hypothetical protein